MPYQGAGVDFGDDRHAVALQVFIGDLLRSPVRADWGKLPRHQAFDVWFLRLGIGGIGAVIADLRIRQDYDLTGVGRISEYLLITRQRCVENDFACAFAARAVALTAEDAPVFERKDSLHRCSIGWIQ